MRLSLTTILAFDELVAKCKEAARRGYPPGELAFSECLLAALVLNRADWLKEKGYTIPEALHRVGPGWASAIPRIAAAVLAEAAIYAQDR